MLHHLSIAVSDLERSKVFYDQTLESLDYECVWSFEDAVGYGPAGSGDRFAIKRRSASVQPPSPGTHIAFAAKSRAHVDAFYAAALEAGGLDNGKPGLREHYGPEYYAAFVIDPDGYQIEAVINGRQA